MWLTSRIYQHFFSKLVKEENNPFIYLLGLNSISEDLTIKHINNDNKSKTTAIIPLKQLEVGYICYILWITFISDRCHRSCDCSGTRQTRASLVTTVLIILKNWNWYSNPTPWNNVTRTDSRGRFQNTTDMDSLRCEICRILIKRTFWF